MNKHSIQIVLGFCLAGQLFASGFATLQMGSDARTTGLGLAATALAEGGSAPFWNPASTGMITGKMLELSLHQWMDDLQSEFAGIVFGNGKQGVGFYLLFTEIDQIEHRIIPSESPLGTFSAHELILGLTYGREIMEDLYLGMAIKGYSQKIYLEDASGLGGDIGLLYNTPFYGIRFGAVLQNLGKTGKMKNESIELPLTGKSGVVLPVKMDHQQLLFSCDGVWTEYAFHLHAGTEYLWHSMMAVQLGVQTAYDNQDITGGIGIYPGKIRLNYSYMPMSVLGKSHRFSFGFSW